MFLFNCIFGNFKLFPSSKNEFWPFLKLQKMDFGQKIFVKLIYLISRFFLAWTFNFSGPLWNLTHFFENFNGIFFQSCQCRRILESRSSAHTSWLWLWSLQLHSNNSFGSLLDTRLSLSTLGTMLWIKMYTKIHLSSNVVLWSMWPI